MKMFSDCSGPCETCYISVTGGCLAGHGDDDYQKITKDDARELLKYSNKEQRKRIFKLFPKLKKVWKKMKKERI